MAEENLTDKGSQKERWSGRPFSKRLFTLKEAACYLGRPVFGVRSLIWAGKLPYVKDGRKQYLDVQDLDRYIERSKATYI
jgi:excisionase family DNA binding protein